MRCDVGGVCIAARYIKHKIVKYKKKKRQNRQRRSWKSLRKINKVKHLLKSDTKLKSKQLQLLSCKLSMDGINNKKSDALEVLSMKIQCNVCCIFWYLSFWIQCTIFCSTYLDPKENGIQLSCIARATTSMFLLMTVRYPTLLIHWNIVALLLVFYCTIAITADFARAQLEELWVMNQVMYSYVAVVLSSIFVCSLLASGSHIACPRKFAL